MANFKFPDFMYDGPEVLDIRRPRVKESNRDILEKALWRKTDYLPKELAYEGKGLKLWTNIAAESYQKDDERKIIEDTAVDIVSNFLTGTIIDLGAGDSKKFEPHVWAFLAAHKECNYVPLDLNEGSVRAQVLRTKNECERYPLLRCVGLYGDFEDHDAYDEHEMGKKVIGQTLWLSLGSIFLNGPEELCHDRLRVFEAIMKPGDALIIGQDGPTSDAAKQRARDFYESFAYTKFMDNYFHVLRDIAGIDHDIRMSWKVNGRNTDEMHYFEIEALLNMECRDLEGLTIQKEDKYTLFPSWKRTEENVKELVTQHKLTVEVIGRAKDSGMRQYLIRKKP